MWPTINETKFPFPVTFHLIWGVAEALVLDLAHLTVDRVSVEVHVARHVVIDTRRVSKKSVIGTEFKNWRYVQCDQIII